MKNNFKGFTHSETFTQFPDSFFQQLLKEIKDADELKVTLYFLWRVDHMEGPFRSLSKLDFDVKELGLSAQEIKSGLEKAVRRGTLLKVERDAVVYFLLNSPRGRGGVRAMERGEWQPKAGAASLARPNIFELYEENIGPLTPLIADALKDAENLYPYEWVVDVIEKAVNNNKRNWKYCEAILKRWKEEGRHGQKNQRDAVKSSERYTQSEFAEYLD